MQTVIVPAKACIYFRWAGLGDHLSRIRSNLGGFVRSDLQGFVGWREEGPYGEDSDLYRPIVVSVPDGAVQATMLATGSWRAFPTMDYFDADGGEWSAETKESYTAAKYLSRNIPLSRAPHGRLVGFFSDGVSLTGAVDGKFYGFGKESTTAIPQGATELVLGMHDAYNWTDCDGEQSVDITFV